MQIKKRINEEDFLDHTSYNNIPVQFVGTCQDIVTSKDKVHRQLETFIGGNVSEPILSFDQMITWQ